MPSGPSAAGNELDLTGVLADIEAEVRARRASGELTGDFERHLDSLFADLAPVDAVVGNLTDLLNKLQVSTTIDTHAPIESAGRGVPQLKAVVGKAIDWELRHLASQVSGLANAITRALFLVRDRLDEVEHDAIPRRDRALAALATAGGRTRLPEGPWEAVVTGVLGDSDGRVLHAECERGALVTALRARGVDAYGIDPVEAVVVESKLAALHPDDARAHLRTVPECSLAGVILSGAPDRLSVAGLLELLALTERALRPGGHMVLIAHRPGPAAAADVGGELAGRPRLQPETLTALAEGAGLVDVAVSAGPVDAIPAGMALVATRLRAGSAPSR
ncbi:MAG: hypothetical protein M3Y91_01825 [Actinomycetota bacterium]|nr:hypothetical protein [Actinomycetota bacterium]